MFEGFGVIYANEIRNGNDMLVPMGSDKMLLIDTFILFYKMDSTPISISSLILRSSVYSLTNPALHVLLVLNTSQAPSINLSFHSQNQFIKQ